VVIWVVDEQQARFRECRFTAVYNFPRLKWFHPWPCPEAASQEAELIHVGSLSRERGSHFLLEVMRELHRTHPTVRLNALGVLPYACR